MSGRPAGRRGRTSRPRLRAVKIEADPLRRAKLPPTRARRTPRTHCVTGTLGRRHDEFHDGQDNPHALPRPLASNGSSQQDVARETIASSVRGSAVIVADLAAAWDEQEERALDRRGRTLALAKQRRRRSIRRYRSPTRAATISRWPAPPAATGSGQREPRMRVCPGDRATAKAGLGRPFASVALVANLRAGERAQNESRERSGRAPLSLSGAIGTSPSRSRAREYSRGESDPGVHLRRLRGRRPA